MLTDVSCSQPSEGAGRAVVEAGVSQPRATHQRLLEFGIVDPHGDEVSIGGALDRRDRRPALPSSSSGVPVGPPAFKPVPPHTPGIDWFDSHALPPTSGATR